MTYKDRIDLYTASISAALIIRGDFASLGARQASGVAMMALYYAKEIIAVVDNDTQKETRP